MLYPLLSPEVGTPENKRIHSTLPSVCKRVRLKSVFFSRMQLTLHETHPTPHGASRLVQAMSAWSVKTRRAPSRHCRDARVYGHTTTACINMSTTPSASTRRSAQNSKRPRPPHRATRKMTAHPPLSLNELPSRFCCLLYTSPSPRDLSTSRMPSSA